MIFKGCGVAKDSTITTAAGVMPAERLPRGFHVLDALTGKDSVPRTARVLSFGAVRLRFGDTFVMVSPGCELLGDDDTWADARTFTKGDLVKGENSLIEVTDVRHFSVVLAATAFRTGGKSVAMISDGVIIRSTTTQQWEKEKCRY